MRFNISNEQRTHWIRRGALSAIVLTMSSFLSLPALLYYWRFPDLTNALSLAFTIGFFAAIFTLIRRVRFHLLIGLPVMALNLIEIVSIVAFGGLISLGGLEAILYVDPNEAREFIVDHSGLIALGALVIPLFLGLALLKKKYDTIERGPRLLLSASVVVVPFGLLTSGLAIVGSAGDVYLPTRIFEHYAAYLGANPLAHTISGIATTLGARVELSSERSRREQLRFNAKRVEDQPPQELYIVVIGESSRKRNWNLYGYKRATNPFLVKTPNLIVFSQAISPATTTSRSIPLSFTLPTTEEFSLLRRTSSFLSAFKEVGFKTYWLSNQGTHRSAVGSQITLLMNEADVVRTTNYGFWNTVLDETLIPELDAALRDPAPRKLIVLHTLGSHTNYRQRYPVPWSSRSFSVALREAHTNPDFNEADSETINDYDKTIMYTDYLLHEIIERHAKTDQYGAVVYLSDHGQRLYDDNRRQKGHGFGDVNNYDVEVPLVLWTSNSFNVQSARKHAAIVANASKPISTADLAASILDLAGIGVDGSRNSRSFVNEKYSVMPRQVMATDGRVIEYDAIIGPAAASPRAAPAAAAAAAAAAPGRPETGRVSSQDTVRYPRAWPAKY